jgi:hypothetical protein
MLPTMFPAILWNRCSHPTCKNLLKISIYTTQKWVMDWATATLFILWLLEYIVCHWITILITVLLKSQLGLVEFAMLSSSKSQRRYMDKTHSHSQLTNIDRTELNHLTFKLETCVKHQSLYRPARCMLWTSKRPPWHHVNKEPPAEVGNPSEKKKCIESRQYIHSTPQTGNSPVTSSAASHSQTLHGLKIHSN